MKSPTRSVIKKYRSLLNTLKLSVLKKVIFTNYFFNKFKLNISILLELSWGLGKIVKTRLITKASAIRSTIVAILFVLSNSKIYKKFN
jgi:hypothetical protein